MSAIHKFKNTRGVHKSRKMGYLDTKICIRCGCVKLYDRSALKTAYLVDGVTSFKEPSKCEQKLKDDEIGSGITTSREIDYSKRGDKATSDKAMKAFIDELESVLDSKDAETNQSNGKDNDVQQSDISS